MVAAMTMQVVRSQMDQEAEVMKQSMARQESMAQSLEKEEQEGGAQPAGPTFKRTVSANRPSKPQCLHPVLGFEQKTLPLVIKVSASRPVEPQFL